MTPPPPGSTLFPYTTLFRSDLPEPVVPAIRRCGMRARSVQTAAPLMSFPIQTPRGEAVAGRSSKMSPRVTRFGERFRSEEHTSELQSRRDLVCRLLLEKKKD